MHELLKAQYGTGYHCKALADLASVKIEGTVSNDAVTFQQVSGSLETLLGNASTYLQNVSWKKIVEHPSIMPSTLDAMIDMLYKVTITGPGKRLNRMYTFIQERINAWWKYISELFGGGGEPEDLKSAEEESNGFFDSIWSYAYDVVKRVGTLLAKGLSSILTFLREALYNTVTYMSDIFYATLECVYDSTAPALRFAKRRVVEAGFFYYSTMCDIMGFANKPPEFIKSRFEVFSRTFGSITHTILNLVRDAGVVISLTTSWLYSTISSFLEGVSGIFEWIISYLPWLTQIMRTLNSAASTVFSTFASLGPLMQKMCGEFFQEVSKVEKEPVRDVDVSLMYTRLEEFHKSELVSEEQKKGIRTTLVLYDALTERLTNGRPDLVNASDKEIVEGNNLYAKLMTSLMLDGDVDENMLHRFCVLRTSTTLNDMTQMLHAAEYMLNQQYLSCILSVIVPPDVIAGEYADTRLREKRRLKSLPLDELYKRKLALRKTEVDYDLKFEDLQEAIDLKENVVAYDVYKAEKTKRKEALKKLSIEELSRKFEKEDDNYKHLTMAIGEFIRKQEDYSTKIKGITTDIGLYLKLVHEKERTGLSIDTLLENGSALSRCAYENLIQDPIQSELTNLYAKAYKAYKRRNEIAKLLNLESETGFKWKRRSYYVLGISLLAGVSYWYFYSWIPAASAASAALHAGTASQGYHTYDPRGYIVGGVSKVYNYFFVSTLSFSDAFNYEVWFKRISDAQNSSRLTADVHVSKFLALYTLLQHSVPAVIVGFATVWHTMVIMVWGLIEWLSPTYHSTTSRNSVSSAVLFTVLGQGSYFVAVKSFNILLAVLIGMLDAGEQTWGFIMSASAGCGLGAVGGVMASVNTFAASKLKKIKEAKTQLQGASLLNFKPPPEVWEAVTPFGLSAEWQPIPIIKMKSLLETQPEAVTVEKLLANFSQTDLERMYRQMQSPQEFDARKFALSNLKGPTFDATEDTDTTDIDMS